VHRDFDSIIDELIIYEAHPKDMKIRDCLIGRVDGVSEAAGLPHGYQGVKWGVCPCKHGYKIKQAKLSSEQKVFVTIIKKTFFQPGSEERKSIITCLGSQELKRSSEKILNMLCREGILTKTKGKEGNLYVPQRSHAHRMGNLERIDTFRR